LASGTIVYPGTIIGSGAKIISTMPLIGYIPPKAECILFLSIRKDRKGGKKIQPEGSLKQHIREYFLANS